MAIESKSQQIVAIEPLSRGEQIRRRTFLQSAASTAIASRRDSAEISAAMREVYKVAPNAGAYAAESDYFQPDWKRAYWGDHYPLLARAKRKYDPQWIFRGRNCVEPA